MLPVRPTPLSVPANGKLPDCERAVFAPGANVLTLHANPIRRALSLTPSAPSRTFRIMSVMSMVSSTSTRAMLAAAESRGFETRDLLDAFGLARAIVDDPDARLSAPTVLALWDALRERSGDPALQLAAPTALPFGAYGVIDYLVYASPTVGEGVARFARFFRLVADGVCLTVDEDGDACSLHIELSDGTAVPGLYVDYVFAALVCRTRLGVRPELSVRRVELRHEAPIDPSPYTMCFQAPVEFDATADRLCFRRDEWTASMAHADPVLADLLEEHARMVSAHLPEPADEFVGAVRRAVTASLPEEVTTATVARALHVSERTLQRKLTAAGTSFRHVCDATRQGLAMGYLSDPRASISGTAFLLGFSDQASFTRAFRRWTGAPPGAWRKRAGGKTPTSG
jgi:AraC-like DNA-binding protein